MNLDVEHPRGCSCLECLLEQESEEIRAVTADGTYWSDQEWNDRWAEVLLGREASCS